MKAILNIFFLLFLVSTTVIAQVYFDEPEIISGGGYSSSSHMHSADIDGDGYVDILTATGNDNKIAWYKNESGTSLGAQRIITTNISSAVAVFAADLDGDGDIDVISASCNDDKIAWYENIDGLGNFGTQQIISDNADFVVCVEAADLDNDGDMDILSASRQDDKIAWYENQDGQGNFSTEKILSVTADGAFYVHAVDLDGDLDLDILAGSQYDKEITWFENINGNFSTKDIITMSYMEHFYAMTTSDCDDDGDIDIIIRYEDVDDGQELAWMTNLNGNFGFVATIDSRPAMYSRSLSMGDLNADGKNDLILSGFRESYAYTNTPQATNKFDELQFVRGKTGIACAADMDNDGNSEIVYMNYISYENEIGWIANPGNGDFGNRVIKRIEHGTSNSIMFHADINGDGSNDLVLNNAQDEISWYENDGTGEYIEHFIGEVHVELDDAQCEDMDGDGDQDLVFMDYSKIGLKKNTDGNGNFGYTEYIGDATLCSYIDLADIDDDGDFDILISNYYGEVICFWHLDDGSYSPEVLLTISEAAEISTADIDGDGDLDLILEANRLLWSENIDGSGSFATPIIISYENHSEAFVTDLDNDNDIDLLATVYGGESVWFENINGFGTFQPRTIREANSGYSIYACDMDNDGDNDIVTNHSGFLTWFEDIGNQSFLHSHMIGMGMHQICSDDRDGDGDEDVFALAGWYSQSYRCLSYGNMNGSGSFNNIKNATIAAIPKQAIAADLNNDGHPDIISASYGDNKIAWYDNYTGHGIFGTQQTISNEVTGANSVSAADIDGDGDIDLVAGTEENFTLLLHNSGSGIFTGPEILNDSEVRMLKVETTDLDSDGDMDILGLSKSNYGPSTFLKWHQNTDGNGTFSNAINIYTGFDPSAFSLGDIDNDSDLDIVICSQNSNDLGWVENDDGNGSFVFNNIDYNFPSPASVFLADLNNDQFDDIITCSAGMNEIYWLENQNGSGSFSDEILISDAVDYPGYVIATDLDQDGDMDIVSASKNDNKICWYENTDGMGNFSSQHVITATADSATYLYTSHINSDLKPDIIYIAGGSEHVAWIENSPVVNIASQPQNTIICPNYDASFELIAVNAISYQWQVNEGSGFDDLNDNNIYSGTSTSSLQISNANISMDNFMYRCLVTGQYGSVTSNIAILSITDNEDPVIVEYVEDQILYAEENCEAMLLDYTVDIEATDNCDDDLSISQSPPPTTMISDSINEIILTVTDDAGNSVTNVFNVSVVDTAAPVFITYPDDQIILANDSCYGILPDYTIDAVMEDNCDTLIEVSQSPEPGTILTGGTHTIGLTITDNSGNSDEAFFNVEVADSTMPVLICVDDQIINLNAGQNSYVVQSNEFDPLTVVDNCALSSCLNDYNNSETLEGAEFFPDTTNVTWTAVDSAGNQTECNYLVIINNYVGIEHTTLPGISIYPNPAENKLFIHFESGEKYLVRINNLLGDEVLRKTDASGSEIIDLSNFASGNYIVTFQNKQKVVTTKIIKR